MSENFSLEDSPGMQRAFANANIEVEPVENGESTESGTSTESGGTESTTEQVGEVKGDPGKDSLSGKPDSGKKQGDKEPKEKVTGNPGDLTLQDGTVVKAGAERRHYESGQIAKQRLAVTQDQLNTANQRYQTLEASHKELKETISKIGLEKPEDVTSAVTLYKDLTRDPVGTMTKLLAEMKVLGHTFEGVGGTVDTAAIQALLDRKLPASEEQKGPTEAEITARANEEVADFIAQFPDAITQEVHIAALIDHAASQKKQLSLQDAYFMLKERVVNDGYDWSKPLGPQIEARKTAATTTKTTETKPRTPGRVVDNSSQAIDPTKVVIR